MSHANSNFNRKCILRIRLSSDFLQIIGRKQIDGRIQKFGWNLKVYPRSNPTQIWPNFSSKTILLRAMIFCVSEYGKYDFLGEMFDWVV